MKALIDLDWLDSEIEQTKEKIKVFQEGHILQVVQIAILGKLEEVRLKCEKVEEQMINGYAVTRVDWAKGTIEDNIPNTFLSKTCVNDWESNAYCPNIDKCLMCKSK